MRSRTRAGRLALLTGLAFAAWIPFTAEAQRSPRYVPRAQPVPPLPSNVNQDVRRPVVVPAQPIQEAPRTVRPAEPLPPDTPSPLDQNPMPVRKALIIEDGESKPAPPPPPRPDSARETQFEYANMVFSYEHYDLAVRQYERFLNDFPSDPAAEVAWYRLGESCLKTGDKTRASSAYMNLLRYYPQGEYAPAAAYRLGALTYEKGDFRTAESNFHVAEARSKQPEIKLSAAFYRARALQQLRRTAEASILFDALSEIKENNPYRDAASLYLARMDFDRKRNTTALDRFLALTESKTSTNAIIMESLVKAGLIYSDKGETDKSAELLGRALALPEDPEWTPLAYYALIQNQYNAGDYEGVLTTYKTGTYNLPDDTRAKLQLMAGNAYRRLGKFQEAIQLYNNVEKYFTGLPEGQEAGYRKLLCFYDQDDANIVEHIDFYVETQRQLAPQLKYIDMALMIKAEKLFGEEKFLEAAAAYDSTRPNNLPDDLRATRLYKLGWAASESGDPQQSVNAFTDFLVLFPDDKLVASALAQRATNYRRLQNSEAAVNDLTKVTNRYPDSEASEFAWQQLALMHGQNREFQKMIAAFSALLKNFPETKGAAEAWYWIGYGRFELKEFKDALDPLAKAREIDEENFFERSTLRRCLSFYYLQDAENLHDEAVLFLEEDRKIEIPAQVLAWLGAKRFFEADYEGAEKFLALASDPENPKNTKADIWSYLGKARIQQKKYQEAVTALDFYLDSLATPSAQAKGLLDKSIAQLGLKQYEPSLTTAREALALEKQGRINALIRIQLGDIAMDRKNYDDAAKEYIIVSEIFLDPEITPRAMKKAAEALEKAGNKPKADAIRKSLSEQFPEFKIVG